MIPVRRKRVEGETNAFSRVVERCRRYAISPPFSGPMSRNRPRSRLGRSGDGMPRTGAALRLQLLLDCRGKLHNRADRGAEEAKAAGDHQRGDDGREAVGDRKRNPDTV